MKLWRNFAFYLKLFFYYCLNWFKNCIKPLFFWVLLPRRKVTNFHKFTNHLRRHVAQNKRFIQISLAVSVISSGREVTSIVAAIPVIPQSCSEEVVDCSIFEKPAPVPTPTWLCFQHVRCQLFHDPIRNSISSVKWKKK